MGGDRGSADWPFRVYACWTGKQKRPPVVWFDGSLIVIPPRLPRPPRSPPAWVRLSVCPGRRVRRGGEVRRTQAAGRAWTRAANWAGDGVRHRPRAPTETRYHSSDGRSGGRTVGDPGCDDSIIGGAQRGDESKQTAAIHCVCCGATSDTCGVTSGLRSDVTGWCGLL